MPLGVGLLGQCGDLGPHCAFCGGGLGLELGPQSLQLFGLLEMCVQIGNAGREVDVLLCEGRNDVVVVLERL